MNSERSKIAAASMAFLVGLYVAFFTYLSWRKYVTFHSDSIDLGLFVRGIWGMTHGSVQNPILGNAYFWAIDLAPILWIFAGLSFVLPVVPLLLFAQSAAFGISAWFVFRRASAVLPGAVAFSLALAFLFHPSVQNANLFDFHAVGFAVLFLTLFLVAIEGNRVGAASLFLLGALLCREEVAGVAAAWGLSHWRRSRSRATVWIAVSFAWVALSVTLKAGNPVMVNSLGRVFGGLSGVTLLELATSKVAAAVALFGAFALLPLFGLRKLVWAALPGAWFLVSGHDLFTRVDFYYLALFAPFFAFAAIEGAAKIMPKIGYRWLSAAILAAGVACFWTLGRAPGSRWGSLDPYRENAYAAEAREVSRRIPENASVAAPHALIGHLAERKEIYYGLVAGPDAVILETTPRRSLGERDPDFENRRTATERAVSTLIGEYGYRPVFEGSELMLFAKEEIWSGRSDSN